MSEHQRTNRLAEGVVVLCTLVVIIVGAIVGLIDDDRGFATDVWLLAVAFCAVAGGLLRHARPPYDERGTRLATAQERHAATVDPPLT